MRARSRGGSERKREREMGFCSLAPKSGGNVAVLTAHAFPLEK